MNPMESKFRNNQYNIERLNKEYLFFSNYENTTFMRYAFHIKCDAKWVLRVLKGEIKTPDKDEMDLAKQWYEIYPLTVKKIEDEKEKNKEALEQLEEFAQSYDEEPIPDLKKYNSKEFDRDVKDKIHELMEDEKLILYERYTGNSNFIVELALGIHTYPNESELENSKLWERNQRVFQTFRFIYQYPEKKRMIEYFSKKF